MFKEDFVKQNYIKIMLISHQTLKELKLCDNATSMKRIS